MFRDFVSTTIRSFLSEQRGATAIVFAVSAATLLVAAGVGVDFQRASSTRTGLQAALDGAVLAGLKASVIEDKRLDAANRFFTANRPPSAPLATAVFSVSDNNMVGDVSIPLPTTFMKLAGITSMNVGAHSAATDSPVLDPACIMALNPHDKHTLNLDGRVSIVGPKCILYGNSDNPGDVLDPHTVDNFITAKAVRTIGGGHHYLENVSPPPEFATQFVPDPLQDISIPAAGACTYTKKIVDSLTVTLNPGVYCQGLVIKHGANVTLSPGTYWITQDQFQIDTATVQGSDVLIILVDAAAKLDWSQATVRLKAPKTGANEGIVMMAARTAMTHTFDDSTVDLYGVVYLPQGFINWTNTGTPTITAQWTAWICDGFSWDGDGVVNVNFNIDGADIPYPNSLRVVPGPGKPRLMY